MKTTPLPPWGRTTPQAKDALTGLSSCKGQCVGDPRGVGQMRDSALLAIVCAWVGSGAHATTHREALLCMRRLCTRGSARA